MKTKQLLYAFIMMGLILSSCRPVLDPSSSVEPDSSDSSEEFSPSGDDSSSEGGDSGDDSSSSSSEDVPQHEHQYGQWTFVKDPDYMNYIKGYNERTCTYPGCGEKERETVYYSKAEMATEMNNAISGKTYFDPFEIRQDLIDNEYPVVDSLSEQEYFGYDLLNNAVVLSSDTSVTKFISFREKEVSSREALDEALAAVGNSVHSYSTIKLAADLNTNTEILLDFVNPVHIDLGGHTINYTPESGAAIKITNHSGDKPSLVAITNGKVQTKEMSGFNMAQTPKCVYFEDGYVLRVTSVNLNNRAERGYAYADYPDKTSTSLVKINNSTIYSPVIGVCIQTNNNLIKDNTINGSVVVNGGESVITHNIINTSHISVNLESPTMNFIETSLFISTCNDVYVTEAESDPIYDKYMLTSVDSILINDRRSVYGTYQLIGVEMDYNDLTCKTVEEGAVGFGIRYVDYNFDASQTSNNADSVIIGDHNVYRSLSGDDPHRVRGGYYI